MTFVVLSVTELAITEFDASLTDTLYMTGQTLVSILAIYFLLDFVFNNDNNCSNNLQDDSEDNSKLESIPTVRNNEEQYDEPKRRSNGF